MNIEDLREYCLSKKGVEESLPFGEGTLVFKVGSKMFMLLSLDEKPVRFNVKCDPLRAIELRAIYTCVSPGYHMNKTHWNTIVCDGSVTKKIISAWIDESYELVFNALPQKIRSQI